MMKPSCFPSLEENKHNTLALSGDYYTEKSKHLLFGALAWKEEILVITVTFIFSTSNFKIC